MILLYWLYNFMIMILEKNVIMILFYWSYNFMIKIYEKNIPYELPTTIADDTLASCTTCVSTVMMLKYIM